MARKRVPSEHKFKNARLNEPILVRRPSILAEDGDIAKMSAVVQKEKARKVKLLLAEFGIELGDSTETVMAGLTVLVYKLADLYVPGMQIAFERRGPGAPKRDGFSRNPALLLAVVEMTKNNMGLESDRKACEFLVISENPDLRSPAKKGDRNKRVRTLANLVSKARRDAAQPRH